MLSGSLEALPKVDLFTLVKGLCKFVLFCGLILLFILHHGVVSILIWDEKKRLNYFLKSIVWTNSLALMILQIKVETENTPVRTGNLIIANHMSYIDVLILSVHSPSLFVTSVEIKETFLLGKLTELAGCFHVERRKSRRTEFTLTQEMNQMKHRVQEGFDVFLFPEGTSSNGDSVLPFKGSFFQLAIDADLKVRPLCLKYKDPTLVAWYGDMTFADHLFRLCLQDSIQVSVTTLPEIEAITFDDKHQLANYAHKLIKDAYETV